MGYHYVNPKNAPFGPIYAWYIPHDVHMKFCGNTSGTKPAFV
jgi:hypothetical protein